MDISSPCQQRSKGFIFAREIIPHGLTKILLTNTFFTILMNHLTRENLNHVLLHVPQIEHLFTQTHMMILDYLKTQRFPRLSKTISSFLQMNYDSTRARLCELKEMGFVFQPNQSKVYISQLDQNGISKINPNEKKCGYSLVKQS